MSLNRVCISGNLCRDIEIKATASGLSVGRLTLAVNERKKNTQTGNWEDVANFISCVLFGARASALAPYIKKGTKVAITGRLHQNRWQDDNGTNHSSIDVIVDDVELMSPRREALAQTQPQSVPAQPSAAQPQTVQAQSVEPAQPAQPAYTQSTYTQSSIPAENIYTSVYDEDVPF